MHNLEDTTALAEPSDTQTLKDIFTEKYPDMNMWDIMRTLRGGRHSKARAERAKARIKKRKSKR